MNFKEPIYYLQNNDIKVVTNNSGVPVLSDGKIIYEVIRIMNGKVLFFEDHLQRFMNSMKQSEVKSKYTPDEITALIYLLIYSIGMKTGNIKFLFYINRNNQDFFAFQIPHNYPTTLEYNSGIKLVLFSAERHSPGIKEENTTLREKTQQYIIQQEAYEALLVNSEGFITEGSKSNFYLIRNNTLFTAPSGIVLEGITAKRLTLLCNHLHISIHEQLIPADSLSDFDAAFITGTSPKILPVNSIEQFKFDVQNPLLRNLMNEFDVLIENYLHLK
jgi:branched-chain amino acid aminotransferase